MANPFYTATGNPPAQSREISAPMRAEFLLIQNGFAAVANIGGLNSGVDTGTANNYIVTPDPAMTAYGEFVEITFLAANANTGASTITANGLGAIAITRRDQTPLQAGDIQANGVYTLIGDGTGMQLQANPLSGNATGPINGKLATAIASAGTVNLNAMTGNYGHITGAVAITAITLASGAIREIVFDGSLVLTNSTNLILPGAQNILTAAGDSAIFVGDASGAVRCICYTPITGSGSFVKITSTQLSAGAASINFLSTFLSRFDNYQIEIENLIPDGAGGLSMQLAVAGAAVSSNSYVYAGSNSSSTAVSAFGTATPASSFALTSQVPASTSAISGTIIIRNVNSTANGYFKTISSNLFYINQGGGISNDIASGQITSSAAVTGLKLFLTSAGNFGANSVVKIYGYQN